METTMSDAIFADLTPFFRQGAIKGGAIKGSVSLKRDAGQPTPLETNVI